LSNEQNIDVLERFKVVEPIPPKKQETAEKTNKKSKNTTPETKEDKHVTTDSSKKEQKPRPKLNIFNPNPPVGFGPTTYQTILDTDGVLLKDVIIKDKDGLVLWTQIYCELKTDHKLMQFRYNDGEILYWTIAGRLTIMLDDGSAISIDAVEDRKQSTDRIIVPRGRRHNVINVIPGTTCCFFMNVQGELDFRELLKD
jgi:hypothetical protein